MISYEELVAALDRYVARNGGTPQSVRGSAAAAAPAYAPPAHEVSFDADSDPDMPSIGHDGGEDATHVGASPETAQRAPEDHSNEIDIGDVLADDELN
jgi:hypothetical protein